MRLTLLFALLVNASVASSAATRSLSADTIQTSSGLSSWSMPNGGSGGALSSASSTDTLSNKTISGASNTLSQLPVSAQINQDVFYGNGTSTLLQLSVAPPAVGGLDVYQDGVLLDLGQDYTFTAGSVNLTMTVAPAPGQKVKCVYSRF